jgi:hypothetical protein
MHAARQFRRQRLIDHAVTFDPALAFERIRHDMDPEVGFASGPMARMPSMLMGLVFDTEILRREGCRQFAGNVLLHGHSDDIGMTAAGVNDSRSREL